jgi:hypothetical protein
MNKCVEYEACVGSKPLYVGSNPRFRQVKYGYLPAQCPCFYYRESPIVTTQEVKVSWDKEQVTAYQQLKSQMIYLTNKVNNLLKNTTKKKEEF